MKFDFFTLGGRFYWEDIYHHQGWRIQRHAKTTQYRLLDPHDIRRDSGYFGQCKETLLKYIEAYEVDEPQEDTVIILHSFGRTKNSVHYLAESLKDLHMNVIVMNYASLKKSLLAHSQLLSQFLKNIEIKRNLYIINVGTACLLTRKLLSDSNNYRSYNIKRILDIAPKNSGSDLAELLAGNKLFRFLLGPMLVDITTRKAITVPKIPQEIEHGIIFCPSKIHNFIQNILKRFDSFPFLTPPSEQSYAENIKTINEPTFFPLENQELFDNCKQYILTGTFLPDEVDDDNDEKIAAPQ